MQKIWPKRTETSLSELQFFDLDGRKLLCWVHACCALQSLVKSLKFENLCDLTETGDGTLLNDSILFGSCHRTSCCHNINLHTTTIADHWHVEHLLASLNERSKIPIRKSYVVSFFLHHAYAVLTPSKFWLTRWHFLTTAYAKLTRHGEDHFWSFMLNSRPTQI